jgi:hypothetical protein
MAKKGVTKSAAKGSRRQMVPPVNVIKLMDEIGGTRTAAKLGVSTTLLYKAKNENAINKVVEVAAASALSGLGQPERPVMPAPSFSAPRGGEVMFMVTLPADKVDMFHRMVSAMGGVAMAA